MDENQTQAIQDYKAQLLQRGLSPRHREAMRRIASGIPVTEVAHQLGYSPNRLHQITNSPLWKREMDKLQHRLDTDTYDALAELRKLQPVGVQVYSDLLQQTTYPSIRQMVAKDLFDRTGVRAVSNAPTQTVTQVQSYEQQLANVRVKYEQTVTSECPIQVIGGTELLADSEDDDD